MKASRHSCEGQRSPRWGAGIAGRPSPRLYGTIFRNTISLLTTVDAAPVADAERHDLDGGDVVVDGNILVVRMHDCGRARSEDHGWRIGVAVEETRIRRALPPADLGIAAGDLPIILAHGL